MKITVDIENIDYESVAELLLPIIRSDAELPAWAKMMLTAAGNDKDMINKVLQKIPEDKKNSMAVRLINGKKEYAIDKFEEIALMNGIKIKIKDINAE